MDNSVVIIDYGCGNVRSLSRALGAIGVTNVCLTSDPETILAAQRVILPGVGSFGHAMTNLKERNLIDPIVAFALSGKPLMGICLGMQLFFDYSQELGHYVGLGLIPGSVESLSVKKEVSGADKVPNVGWAPLSPNTDGCWAGTILEPLSIGVHVYFVHSFVAKPTSDHHVLAVSNHNDNRFCAVTRRENIFGCQFHPEKSSLFGLKILKNFIKQ